MQIYTEYKIYSDRFLRELILLKRTQQLPRLKQKNIERPTNVVKKILVIVQFCRQTRTIWKFT